MYCQRKITHTIEAGDSLYKLAKQYDTTVTELILGNPGANPYNLQIGARLSICPGARYLAETEGNRNPTDGNMTTGSPMNGNMGNGNPAGGNMGNANMSGKPRPGNSVQGVSDEMRLAWLAQIYWVRMYLMSVVSQAGDRQEVEERMMETADEITDVFAEFLPISMVRELRTLLMQMTERIGEAVRNLASGLPYDFSAWEEDAGRIADLLERYNPYYENDLTKNQLLNYFDLTQREIEEQMAGMYAKSIDTFRDLKSQVLEMADYFARGLFVR